MYLHFHSSYLTPPLQWRVENIISYHGGKDPVWRQMMQNIELKNKQKKNLIRKIDGSLHNTFLLYIILSSPVLDETFTPQNCQHPFKKK